MKHLQLEEIKVGNYILYDGFKIKLDGSLLAQYIQNELPKKFYPIKLDAEFLDKTAFIKYSNSYEFWRNSAFGLELSKNGKWEVTYMGDYLGKQIEFIHQLQNFYYEVGHEMLWVAQHSI